MAALATFDTQLDFFLAITLMVQDIPWSPCIFVVPVGVGYYRRW